MLAVLHSVLTKLAGYWQTSVRSWRRLSLVLCAFFPRGRDALLRLVELVVEERQQQLAKQRVSDVIEHLGKTEALKSPQARKIAITAISAEYRVPLGSDDTTLREHRPAASLPPHPSVQ